jgi:hypothetical protein
MPWPITATKPTALVKRYRSSRAPVVSTLCVDPTHTRGGRGLGARACARTMTAEVLMLIKPSRMADLGYVVAAEASEVSLDEFMAARAACRRACGALGLDAGQIWVRWFHQTMGDTPGAMRTTSGQAILGRFNPAAPQRIEIRTGQSLADIRRAVFHELRHLAQQCWWGLADGTPDIEWREQDASRWADAMMMRSEGA